MSAANERATSPVPAGAAIPADDGSFDSALIEQRTEDLPDGEERVARWLYDYASYALFLARPHLQRRDGDIPRNDHARISLRVASLLAPLAPIAPRIAFSEAPPSKPSFTAGVTQNGPTSNDAKQSGARKTTPATPDDASTKTARLPPAKLIVLPGVDPTRTVRMKPISDEHLARKVTTAAIPPRPNPSGPRPRANPHAHPAVRIPPGAISSPVVRAATPAGAPAPARAPAPAPAPAPAFAPSAVSLSIPSLVGLVVLVAGVAAVVAVVVTRGM